jgi:signal transduction histidine kinase/ActR/RegA family two-component response regulator
MDCERAFLSLIDSHNQFICAEMTRHQSLAVQNAAQPLLLGVASIALEWGVCPYTMSVFSGKPVTLPDSPYITANKSYFYIKDFRQIPSFATRPYVAGYPAMVSYVEVPLRSNLGHIIGSYCVVDNRLRDFIEPKALDTMREVTAAISSYLDTKRVEASRTRSEKMMDGLRQFIESERETYSLESSDNEAVKATKGPFDLHVFHRTLPMDIGRDVDLKDREGQFQEANDNETRPLDQTEDAFQYSNRPQGSASDDPAKTAPVFSSIHPDRTVRSSARQSSVLETADTTLPLLARPKPHFPDLATQVSDLFSKAASMIGYALNLDGLVFFDATSTGTRYRSGHSPPISTDVEPSQPMMPESDLLAKPLSEYRSRDANKLRLRDFPSQSLINRLTAEYAQGHVFAMDEYGVFDYSSDYAADVDKIQTKDSSAFHEWNELFRCIPEARYVAFLPLWHYQREACFATCLAWVTDTGKTLDPTDINSLTGFGNSLIAEIMRMEAFTNTLLKSDFISSMSHELRSPLHGILATVELMQQGVKDPELLSLVNMIESCSNTLLHTFDHLLEFTRINSRASNEWGAGHNLSLSRSVDDQAKREIVDLGMLIEDVLEMVLLGHVTSKERNYGIEKEQHAALAMLPDNISPQPVLVTTYIETGRSWTLPLEISAWKRILLNLCNNALEYTITGHVDVALNWLEGTDSECSQVSLSVTDTGIGMSPEFLKHHIFTPFTQENVLSPGTGLGLSIVKSIVESIQGEVFVESRLHEGTRVTIKVPVEQESEPLQRPGVGDNLEHRLQGLSLGMLSITSDGASPRPGLHVATPSKVLERCVRNICGEMCGMTVTNLSSCTLPTVDVVLIETQSSSIPNDLDLGTIFPEASARTRATAVVVVDPLVQDLHKFFGAREASCVTQPITRRRLRDALISALDRADVEDLATSEWTETVKEDAISLPVEDSAVVQTPTSNSLQYQPKPGTRDSKATAVTAETLHPKENLTLGPATKPTYTSRFKRFLLVDDNPINLKVLSEFIKRLNAPFSLAINGAEAVRLYRQAILEEHDQFDICFMDISMPVQNGFQATAAIRQFEDEQQCNKASRAHILALTGLGSDNARDLARESGFDGYLLKPVKFNDILPLLSG